MLQALRKITRIGFIIFKALTIDKAIRKANRTSAYYQLIIYPKTAKAKKKKTIKQVSE